MRAVDPWLWALYIRTPFLVKTAEVGMFPLTVMSGAPRLSSVVIQ